MAACGPHIVKTFFLLKKQKRDKLETQKQNKNQGNILVLLHFNQAIVLLWCSHYGINVGPEHAQTRWEN